MPLQAQPGLYDNGRDQPTVTGTPMTASFAHLSRSLYVLGLTLGLAVPALAQDAQMELLAAQMAVQRATDADADQYAADLLAQARDGLLAAQAAAMDKKQRKQAPVLAQRAAVDADLARALSEEAVANADLKQRRAEVAQLQRGLGEGK